MVRRLFWVCLPSLLTHISFASDNTWNCQKDKDSKEWVCLGDKKTATALESAELPHLMPTAPKVRPAADESAQPQTLAPSESVPIKSVNTAVPALENTIKTEIAGSSTIVAPIAPVNNNIITTPEKTAEPVTSSANNTAKSVSAATTLSDANKPTSKIQPMPSGKMTCSASIVENVIGGCNARAKTVAINEEKIGPRLLEPAFDTEQEKIFKTLQVRFPIDPWRNCSMDVTTSQEVVSNNKPSRENSPVDMNSNYAEIYDNQIGNYYGDVEISRADQRASSRSANYDTISETLNLQGNVTYSEDQIAIHTDSATLKLNTDQAKLRDSLFVSPSIPLRGRAKTIYRDNQNLSRYRDVAYTSCRPGNQDWAIHASELKLNKQTGKGAAKNAWLEFKGLPVFYSPYLSFPMDDRRHTGFLAPVFGNTRSNGFDFSTPFYWNIAPNYDATLRPRYLMERGLLLAADFHYLTQKSHGTLSAEFLPNDNKKTGNALINNASDGENPNYGKSRYQLSFENLTQFTPKINSHLDLNYVSDKNYFSDLGNSLSFTNFKYVKSIADLQYNDKGISLTGQIVNYQRVDESVKGRKLPYRKLPQINLAMDHAFEGLLSVPIVTELNSEYVYFQHDDSIKPPEKPTSGIVSVPEGNRINIQPSVSLPWKTDSAYITPKASLQYTQYFLDNQGITNSSMVSRILPIISVDSGIYLERNLNIAGNTLLHTLEPRLFYLYIPKINQKDIPLFDSALYDFTYSGLFRENRFSGTDRIQDANQITLALTSRLIDPTSGQEKFKFNIGDILYLQDREVTLAYFDQYGGTMEAKPQTQAFRTQRFSNLIIELGGRLNDHFSADTNLQWNPRTNHIERGNVGLHFVNNPGELVNLGFKFRKDEAACRNDMIIIPPECVGYVHGTTTDGVVFQKSDIIQTDASFRWPIYNDWYGIGRWQYSWLYGRTQEAFFGLEKENCCWRFRIIGRRYFNGITNLNSSPSATTTSTFDLNTAQAQTGVFFQIELKGLTGIGQKLDTFFEQNVYGYQSP